MPPSANGRWMNSRLRTSGARAGDRAFAGSGASEAGSGEREMRRQDSRVSGMLVGFASGAEV